jgi:hypothetical protein
MAQKDVELVPEGFVSSRQGDLEFFVITPRLT